MRRERGVASKLVPATPSKTCARYLPRRRNRPRPPIARGLKIVQAPAQLSNAQAPIAATSLQFPPSRSQMAPNTMFSHGFPQCQGSSIFACPHVTADGPGGGAVR